MKRVHIELRGNRPWKKFVIDDLSIPITATGALRPLLHKSAKEQEVQ